MRSLLAAVAVFGAATLAPCQEKPKGAAEAARFGVAYRPKGYAQETPKQALESVIAAADQRDFSYLVAFLLDPAFVDVRVGDRARQLEPAAEAELVQLRDFQQKNLDKIVPEARVPLDPAMFRERVAAMARAAAFRQVVRDVQEKLTDDVAVLKDLRRFAREGTFPEGGDTAKVGLPDVKDRAVYLKKIGDRWYVENRQSDERAAEPKKE